MYLAQVLRLCPPIPMLDVVRSRRQIAGPSSDSVGRHTCVLLKNHDQWSHLPRCKALFPRPPRRTSPISPLLSREACSAAGDGISGWVG